MAEDAVKEKAPPQTVTLDPEMRKIVLAGVKFLLARLKQNKAIEVEVEYKDILLTPLLMQKYLNLLRDNLEIGKDLFVDEVGKPVVDLETPLICGATLGEIERLLVYTSASKVFITGKKKKVVKEKKKKGFALFGRKNESDEEDDEEIEEGAEKLADLKPYLIYAWQLPLIDAYNNLQREHYRALGDALLFWIRRKK